MDAISLTASIIAVLGLADRIKSYIGSVKEAKSDISRILAELQDLEVVLKALKNPDSPPSTSACALCVQSLAECERAMKKVLAKLEPSFAKSLRWPLREKDVGKLLRTIGHQKATISLAVNIEVRDTVVRTEQMGNIFACRAFPI